MVTKGGRLKDTTGYNTAEMLLPFEHVRGCSTGKRLQIRIFKQKKRIHHNVISVAIIDIPARMSC